MKFTIQISEGSHLEFRREPWFGSLRITVDGRPVIERSGPQMWFGFEPVKRYELHAGSRKVLVEHERPLLFGGLRPHDYRVFVDGQIVHKQHGY